MLKDEIKRIETVKGVKGTLQTGQKMDLVKPDDELIKLRGENGRLRNQVKCFEIEVSQKKEKIEKLMRDCIGAPDERLEEKEMIIESLQEDVKKLRTELSRMMGQQNLPQKTGRDETERMLKDITSQNASLRLKLDNAMQKIATLEKK